MLTTETAMTRIQRALFVRDATLELLARYGSFEDTNIGPVLTAQVEGFKFLHRSPFQRVTWLGIQRSDAIVGPPDHLRCQPFSLDAWYNRRKVLSMDWDERITPRLLLFQKGSWEERLCSLCGFAADSAISAAWAIPDERYNRVARPRGLTPGACLAESQAKTRRQMPLNPERTHRGGCRARFTVPTT
jgi:hypothetical protein